MITLILLQRAFCATAIRASLEASRVHHVGLQQDGVGSAFLMTPSALCGLPSTARGLLPHGEEPLPPEAHSGDRRQAHAYAAALWERATLALPTGSAATALHRMATGATVEPVPPWILSGCMTNANS